MMMRRILLAGLIIHVACASDNVTPPTPGVVRTLAIAREAVESVDDSCHACAFGPVTFERGRGKPVTQTMRFAGDPTADYIIDVDDRGAGGSDGGVLLNGFPVISSKNASLRTRQAVTLQNENTLAVRLTGKPGTTLRISLAGGVKSIGIAGGSLRTPSGNVELIVPTNALPATLEITSQPARTYPGGIGIVPGSPYEFLPTGTQFLIPVQLSLAYNPALLPNGISESSLQVMHAVNGRWIPVPNSKADQQIRRVVASISGFSSYAVGYVVPSAGPMALTLPVASSRLTNVAFTQAYAGFGTYPTVPNKYHSGLDLEPLGGSVDAVSSADGWIVLVQENDVAGRVAGKCVKPSAGVASGCKDHGFGNTVIIQHGSVYAQYSHLANLEFTILNACGARNAMLRARCPSQTSWVPAGQRLGALGGTGYGLPNAWGTHLHFETKSFPYLGLSPAGTPSDDCGPSTSGLIGGCGYHASHPDGIGYENPVVRLHQAATLTFATRSTAAVDVLIGPGAHSGIRYPVISMLAAGVSVNIKRVAGATTTPQCSEWYQAIFQGAARLRYASGSGYAEDGWLCADALSAAPPGSPAVPSGLAATGVSSSAINLNWADNSSDEDEFVVESATSSSGPFTLIAQLNPNTASYLVTGLVPSTTYYFRVAAKKAGIASGYSNIAVGMTTAPIALAPPSILAPGFSAAPGQALGTLTPVFTWTAVSGATGYGLYVRDLSSSGAPLVFPNAAGITNTPLTGTSFSLPAATLMNGHQYQWHMTSFSGTTESAQGGALLFVSPPLFIAAPSNLQAVPVSTSEIDFLWNDNSSSEDGFTLLRRPVGGSIYTRIPVLPNVTYHRDDRLPPGSSYEYSLIAVCVVAGIYFPCSTPSNVVTTSTIQPMTLKQISASQDHSCGLDLSGRAYCWGRNEFGQLGNGTQVHSTRPSAVATNLSFVTIATSEYHSCAITSAGEAYCWGGNQNGEIGDGSTATRLVPTQVVTSERFKDIGAGSAEGLDYTCALTQAGKAMCWGANQFGQVGNGSYSSPVWTPTFVTGGATFTHLTVGDGPACGLDGTGAAFCWGYLASGGGVAFPDVDFFATPRPLVPTLRFREIDAGFYETCGITIAGLNYCWTVGSTSQIANGYSFTSLRAGVGLRCGLTASSELYCWGNSLIGLSPTLMGPASIYSAISLGRGVCAMTTGSNARCLGQNTYGGIGDGTTTPRWLEPVAVRVP